MTDCPAHGRPLQVVCGVEVCGLCYESDMLAEPMHDNMRQQVELEYVYSPAAHRKIMRKKRPALTATLAKV